MALTVEDGTGLAAANSYVEVADVSTYISLHGDETVWDALTTEQKEDACRSATRYLEATYYGLWKGVRKTSLQALAWPRYNVIDGDGYLVSSDSLPTQLTDACCYMAERIGVQGDSVLPVELAHGIKSERIKAAVIERDVEYIGSKSADQRYPMVENLLRPITTSSPYSALGPTSRG